MGNSQKAENPATNDDKLGKSDWWVLSKWGFLIAGLFVVFFGVQGSFYGTEPQEITFKKTVGGSISAIHTTEGLRMKVPFFQYADKIRKDVQEIDITEFKANASDNYTISFFMSPQYRLNPAKAEYFYRNFKSMGNFEEKFFAILESQIKIAVANFSTFEVNTKRIEVIDVALAGTQNIIDTQYENVVNIELITLNNVVFPPAYNKHIADKTAQREKLETEKGQLAIEEVKAQVLEKQAKSKAVARKLEADGEAVFITKTGEAEANVIAEKGKAEGIAIGAVEEAIGEKTLAKTQAEAWRDGGAVPTTSIVGGGEGGTGVTPFYPLNIRPTK